MVFPWNMFRFGIWFWDQNLGWWYDDFPRKPRFNCQLDINCFKVDNIGNDSKFNPWNGHGRLFWWFRVDNCNFGVSDVFFFVFHRIAWRCHLCSSHQWRGVMVKADVANRGLWILSDRGRVPGIGIFEVSRGRYLYRTRFFSTVFYFSILKRTMGLQPANIKTP